MIEITPTAAERARERLATAHLQQAIAALREDGVVVINAVVVDAHLDALRERMTADLARAFALCR